MFSDGDAGTIITRPAPETHFPLYVGFGYGEQRHDETITLDNARARLTQNTSRATVRLDVCTRRPVADGTLTLGTTYASDDAPSKYCTRLRPIHRGMRIHVDDGREYFVATVTAQRPGRARLGIIDLGYTRGWSHLHQHGTQHIRQFVTINAGAGQITP